MNQKLVLPLVLLFGLVACGGEDPLPTPLSRDTAIATAGLPSDAEFAETQTALAPTPTIFRSPTLTPTPTDTFTAVPTETPVPTQTSTFSPIQETEMFISVQRTAQVETATAQVPPTATDTVTPTDTPTVTPTASQTPLPTVPLPDVPAPNRIIFSSNRAGSYDIWLMALDGSSPALLMLSPDSDELRASCSPDGEQFVFDRESGDGYELYIGYFDDRSPRPLSDTEGENFAPVWSPTGSLIAFVTSREGQNDIWIMDSGGGSLAPVTRNPADDIHPQWSPDGEWLYYVSNRDGQYDIYAYEFASGEEVRVTMTENVNESAPALGYDLKTLAYIADLQSGDPSTGAMWVTTLEDTPRAAITAAGRVDMPAWIANGRVLVAADLGGITHIMLVDLLNRGQNILTNVGPVNTAPRPCYVALEADSAALPTGIAPTPTASATADLTSAYTAVINPGADWESTDVRWSLANLAVIAPEDYRLGEARARLQDDKLIYSWEDAEDNLHTLTLAPQALDGALAIVIESYTVNGLPEDEAPIADLPFVIGENILLDSIPPGNYRLESIDFADDGITLTFIIPPDSN